MLNGIVEGGELFESNVGLDLANENQDDSVDIVEETLPPEIARLIRNKRYRNVANVNMISMTKRF